MLGFGLLPLHFGQAIHRVVAVQMQRNNWDVQL